LYILKETVYVTIDF